MDVADSLAARLAELTFADLTTDAVTALIIDAIADWAADQGWRVYRRAASVVPLPPPMQRQHSVLDVAAARPSGPPLAIEVDHTDRRRTVEKLVAEAAAGRIGIWVRWGTGRFTVPPEPIRLVTVEVTRHPGARFSRGPDLPPPEHSADGTGDAVVLPFPDT
jgi:uncharacterized UPF0146 family protein